MLNPVPRRARSLVYNGIRRTSLGQWATHDIRPVGGTPGPVHGPDNPIFGLMTTWNEEEIVYASVRHGLELGLDAVFVLDNASDDATVAEAEAAGASVVMSYSTAQFDEAFKYELVNRQIPRLTAEAGHHRAWWLMMDADEFLEPPQPSLRQLLAETDARARVVGARSFDHYPSSPDTYEPRTNPLPQQALCVEQKYDSCPARHHKHPLLLWDDELPAIRVSPGFHTLRVARGLLRESHRSVTIHHHPLRNESVARQRLAALAKRGSTEESHHRLEADRHMLARLRSLDAVYAGEYDKVLDHRTGKPGIEPTPWQPLQDL